MRVVIRQRYYSVETFDLACIAFATWRDFIVDWARGEMRPA